MTQPPGTSTVPAAAHHAQGIAAFDPAAARAHVQINPSPSSRAKTKPGAPSSHRDLAALVSSSPPATARAPAYGPPYVLADGRRRRVEGGSDRDINMRAAPAGGHRAAAAGPRGGGRGGDRRGSRRQRHHARRRARRRWRARRRRRRRLAE